MAKRLAASLCAGIGGPAGTSEVLGVSAAYRTYDRSPAHARAWRPRILPGGRLAIFHGFLDNADELKARLGIGEDDPGLLYAAAVQRWGDDADNHVVGDYCALLAEVDEQRVRLARSPFRAPPLYHHHSDDRMIAGSVPRIFFAAGLPQRLNETRVVDSAMMNFADQEASWFQGIHRVPLGSIVELTRGRKRRLHAFHDPLSIEVREISDQEALARTSALLDEAVRACLKGSTRPGVTLSGGLDSPQVALRALDAQPADRKLPCFTFVTEPGWDGIAEPRTVGCERGMVERFAELHPRLETHFTDNRGIGHDHRWPEFFHLMGGAPSGMTNMYVFHGLFEEARRAGCDRLLVAEWGNNAFSDKGLWAYVEYFLTGKWRQLYLALRDTLGAGRPLPLRFLTQTIMPLAPDWLWAAIRRLVFGRNHQPMDGLMLLTRAFRERSGADRRVKEAGFKFGRYQPWNARHAHQLLLQNDDCEGAEVYQAFEQYYGIPQRDPLAYRPLVEFIWSLPTRMFMRDGQARWLAKQIARGTMPEEQRANQLNGRWDMDWHLRIGRRRADYLAELKRIDADPRFSGMFDVPRLTAALEDWPEETVTDFKRYAPLEFGVPRAILAARFINWAEGRNNSGG